MTTLSAEDMYRDLAAQPKRTLYAAANTNGKWCEVQAESTSRLMAIAALVAVTRRPADARKEDANG